MITRPWRIAVSVLGAAFVTFLVGWLTAVHVSAFGSSQAVTTYHYDNLRTGWNSNETTLTPNNVNRTQFGLLHSVTLDEQVDAQPLIVFGENITAGQHQGEHDVVYVATENNTIYAIDASSGLVLLSANFGPAVPTPLGCVNNSSVVGINGTPVIDLGTNSMYVIVYTLGDPSSKFLPSVPTYTIHELDLGNLRDWVTPVVVAASQRLTDGSIYNFNATVERQRPALLEANGNIYAGFGSFCDFATSTTRGWVLGWQKGTLKPLPYASGLYANNKLTDRQTPPRSSFYLSSVWMSGYGLAGDASGNVYFVTGNSDSTHDVYDGVADIQESVVKLAPNLLTMTSIFTPADEFSLDQSDRDFGAGGVLLLPPQVGPIPNLAAAAGKEGNLFLLNQAALGGFSPTNSGIVDEVSIGPCWCGQSYFSTGTPNVVSSGGRTVILWNLQTSPSVRLIRAASQSITSGQDFGFMTSISSSGSSNAIIWAVSRPLAVTSASVTLYAINAQPSSGRLPVLFTAVAGSWTHLQANANIVPVVANGHVYVASDRQLSIFGLLGTRAVPEAITLHTVAQNVPSDSAQHKIFGTISSINGSQLTIRTRTGSLWNVDASIAIQNDKCIGLEVGGAVFVQGTFDTSGVLQADSIQRAKHSPDLWPSDN